MAGQIPRQFIDDLLARTDIVELIDQRVPLKKAGKNYSACCPFHSEKTPSFTVSADKQFYHCFGCGAHGNAISFMMEFEQLEFVEAIEELAKQLHLEVPREQSLGGKQRPAAQADDYTLMQQATEFYQTQLQQHPHAPAVQQYLQKRGLSADTISAYQLGYAPDGWDNLLKRLNPVTHRTLRDQLFELKLINRNDNGREYDFFRDRIMFPIRDKRGRVIAFGGRVMGDALPKYLNSPETRLFHKGRELYGLYEARQQPGRLDQVLIVEGYMDVVALAEHDIRFAVACLGTATTAEHMQTLFRYTPKVVCCYDGDRAGRDAAWRALQSALPQLKDGVELNFVFLPDGEDPDSLVQKEGKAAFLQRIEQATPLTQYFFEHLMQEFDPATDAGKSALSVKASELLRQIPSEFYRDSLTDKLDNLLGKKTVHVRRTANKAASSRTPAATKITPMRRAIALLLQNPNLVTIMPHAPELAEANIPGMALLLGIQQHLLNKPSLTTAQLLEYWRDLPEYPILLKLASWEHAIEPEQLSQDFMDTFHSIENQYLQQRLEALERKDKLTQLSKAEWHEYHLLLQTLKSKKTWTAT